MRRFFAWLFMVILFTGAIVGGSLAFLYYHISEEDLPPAAITFADQTLDQPVGHHWQVPILGGVVWREFYYSPGQKIQTLEPVTTSKPTLVLSPEMTETATTLELTDESGSTVFSGTAAQWKDFSFEENGAYSLTIRAGREESTHRPAEAYGWYQYQCRFTVNATPQLTLSTESARQGDTVAVHLSGLLGEPSDVPTADTDLGHIWFHPVEKGFMGYIGIPYNAPGGAHDITVQLGDLSLTATLSVGASQYTTTPMSHSADASEQANAQFRDKIYGLYNIGNSERWWSGGFSAPVAGSIFQPYGAYLTASDGSRSGQAPNLTFVAAEGDELKAPAGGKIVLAEPLLLTGNTVVIDHGCGVKSYLYHLQDISVSVGDMVEQDQMVGHAKKLPIWEVRIGNKSVDPAKLLKTTGGLFYQPR